MANARQSMIESAAGLLAKHGLSGASFAEVLEASGAPRGSIYHHFPDGKDQLVAAAVALAGERAVTLLDTLAGESAVVVTQRFLGMWRTVLERSAFGAGCAVLAVTVETDSAEMLERTADVFRRWRHRISQLLAEGGLSEDDAASMAVMLVATTEGAVAVARAERSFEPFDLAAAMLLRLVRERAGQDGSAPVSRASSSSM
jgi:TetR/AcrR family transcriptional regulator, lmrAB and yxaGH operons repressor